MHILKKKKANSERSSIYFINEGSNWIWREVRHIECLFPDVREGRFKKKNCRTGDTNRRESLESVHYNKSMQAGVGKLKIIYRSSEN